MYTYIESAALRVSITAFRSGRRRKGLQKRLQTSLDRLWDLHLQNPQHSTGRSSFATPEKDERILLTARHFTAVPSYATSRYRYRSWQQWYCPPDLTLMNRLSFVTSATSALRDVSALPLTESYKQSRTQLLMTVRRRSSRQTQA
jgi:hypothetical protein